MIETIKKLLPRGLAWLLPAGYMRALMDGIALSFDRLALFLESVATEANPATAIDCLEEWFDQYGIPWMPTGSVEGKQEDILSRYITLGGQDIVYFQRMIDEAGFDDIIISETPITRATYTTDAGVTNSNSAYTFDLTPYAGQTVKVGIWLENRTLTTDIVLVVLTPSFTNLGSTTITLTADRKLYTFDIVVPATPSATATFYLDPQAVEVAGEAFDFDNAFIGGLEIDASEWTLTEATRSYFTTVSPEIFGFNVNGSVNIDADFNRLATLVQRLSPAHCYPIYDVAIAGNVWGEGLYGEAVCSGR